jgi:hypothetical protein
LHTAQELDEWYPGSKFVLTTRQDALTAVNSEMNMVFRNSLSLKVCSFPTSSMF